MPTMRAIAVASAPPNRPTSSEMRLPKMSWEAMSRPLVLVPSQCSPDGGRSGVKLPSSGSWGAISGAKTAIRT